MKGCGWYEGADIGKREEKLQSEIYEKKTFCIVKLLKAYKVSICCKQLNTNNNKIKTALQIIKARMVDEKWKALA